MDVLFLSSCLNEMLKCLLTGDGSSQRYITVFQVLYLAWGVHLEPLSREGDRLSLASPQTCVGNVSTMTEYPHENNGVQGDGFPYIADFSKG